MHDFTATYSPEDNKLRLYAVSRLPRELYEEVKAHGFKWAPKQELFVAPMWTPEREDFLLTLVDEIEDEDKSLVDRAEERADRFDNYSERRRDDAHRARETVAAIADNIPLGQPILVGHHSERRARRDAERIENGMRKAVRLWEQSTYWQQRAAGAIRHAKYKELPAVRHRRIKTLEADRRKWDRSQTEAQDFLLQWTDESRELTRERALHIADRDHVYKCFTLEEYPRTEHTYEGSKSVWSALDDQIITPEQARDISVRVHNRTAERCARWLSHLDNRLAYERAMLAEAGGLAAEGLDVQPGGQVLVGSEWLTIVRVNKKGGQVVSVTTNSRYVRVKGIELVKDYRPPTEEAAEQVKAATSLAPLCNYPGDGFEHMTKAEWDAKYRDYKGTRTVAETETTGRHRVRYYIRHWNVPNPDVFLTDAPVKHPPKPEGKAEPVVTVRDLPVEVDEAARLRELEARARAAEARKVQEEEAAPFEQLKGARVEAVSAPQLFPTPPELAARMADLAQLKPGLCVLEPSAGTGNLVRAILDRVDTEVLGYELSTQLCAQLSRTFPDYKLKVQQRDFLEVTDFQGCYPRVVMNPPFKDGEDIKHIRHAITMLAPGGRLVALCANGHRQREQLKPLADYWEDLPADTFREQGTGVRVALLVIDKAPERVAAAHTRPQVIGAAGAVQVALF